MGGSISLESKPGLGSTFTVRLPAQYQSQIIAQETNAIEDQIYDFQGVEILIAEDDKINFLLLQEYLNNTNCRVYHADDGSKVYGMIQKHPDMGVVLMDIKMPGLNGIDAMKLLRVKNIDIPVIAQTAYTFDYNGLLLTSMGFDDFISKPVNRNELLMKINKHLRNKVPAGSKVVL